MLRVPCCRPEFADHEEDKIQARCGWAGGGYVEIPDSGETLTRTEFQVNYLREIATRPDFVHFAGSPMIVEPGNKKYRGPTTVLWYDDKENLNSARLGQTRVIKEYKV